MKYWNKEVKVKVRLIIKEILGERIMEILRE